MRGKAGRHSQVLQLLQGGGGGVRRGVEEGGAGSPAAIQEV